MQQTPAAHLPAAAHTIAAVSLFTAIYIGSFVTLGYGASVAGLRSTYWIALAAAAIATFATIRVMERGEWSVGFFVSPRFAVPEWMLGVVFATVVIGLGDLLIVLTSATRHVAGQGLPGRELLVVYVPAAIHEELLFRGYIYQRLRVWSRPAAIVLTAALFSALHAGNGGVTAIALVNIALAGVLLAIAYDCFDRLWFPIGIHLAWNILSGPVLGYDVSGYSSEATLLKTVSSAPAWASGGAFGIEGSAWMIPVELLAIGVLAAVVRRRGVAAAPLSPSTSLS